MKQNKLSELTIDQLVKKRELLKGVSIGIGILYIFVLAVVVYLFVTKELKNFSYAALIPVLALPVTLTPVLANISLLEKEIKSRNENV